MEKFVATIGFAVLFGGFILIAAPIGVALGWVAGWTVSILFNDLVLSALGALVADGVTLPQLGAALGFGSAFLRTQTTVKGK